MQHGEPIADGEHDLHVVFDQQHRDVPAVDEIAQRAGESERLFHRQSRGRLVEQQDLRPTDQGQSKIEAALIAVADIACRPVGQSRQVQLVHNLRDVGVRHRP